MNRRVLALALASRLLMLALMAASHATFSDLDSSGHLQNFPCSNVNRTTSLSNRTSIIDGFAPWDSVYFIRIAKCGYQNDMTNAFFPLLPLLLRYGAAFPGMSTFSSDIPIEHIYTVIGLFISIAAFCVAAVALHSLSGRILKNEKLAATAVLLFCCNPASVFYSSVYTESLFAACTWVGLALLPQHRWAGVVALTAAGTARSNGILAVWFLLHPLILNTCRNRKLHWGMLFKVGLSCALIWSPYLAMQVYGYYTYCAGAASGEGAEIQSGSALVPSWCLKVLPSLYAHVQDAYWDVGFLRFYGHWPWLLQSAPVLYLATASCWHWAASDWTRSLSLGILSSLRCNSSKRKVARSSTAGPAAIDAALLDEALAPYIYHLAAMTAMAALMMHVNVATRFLSSSPALYWFAAGQLLKRDQNRPRNVQWASDWIWLWALASALLGCILFPNFYPWT